MVHSVGTLPEVQGPRRNIARKEIIMKIAEEKSVRC